MKMSNRVVKDAIRERRSSKPKLMLGRVSAIEGADAEEKGGRVEREVEKDGSKSVAITIDILVWIIMGFSNWHRPFVD